MIRLDDLVGSLAHAAFGAMPSGRAEEFAAYLGHPGFDRRWLNRVAPARLPEVTINQPSRRPRKARIRYDSVPRPDQPRLL